MANYFTKENISIFINRLSLFFNIFFPGIVILEVFFHKGFFSSAPTTYIQLIIFLFWAGIFSLPFNLYPYSVAFILRNWITKLNKKIPLNPTQEYLARIKEELKEEAVRTNNSIRLGFNFIRLILLYIINKVLMFYNVPSIEIIDISKTIMHLIISAIIVAACTVPLAKLFSFVYINYMINAVIKHNKE